MKCFRRKLSSARPLRRAVPRSYRPMLEGLEDRCLLSTLSFSQTTLAAATAGVTYSMPPITVTGGRDNDSYDFTFINPNGPAITSPSVNVDGLQFAQPGTGSDSSSFNGLPPKFYLAGVPAQQGSFPFAIYVKDGDRDTASQMYTLTVGLGLAPDTPVPAVAGAPYSQTFAVVGGSDSYGYSIMPGNLDGLTLSASGVLSGTPSAPTSGTSQQFPFTIQVTDLTNPSNPVPPPTSYTLNVVSKALTMNPDSTPPATTVASSTSVHVFAVTDGSGGYSLSPNTDEYVQGLYLKVDSTTGDGTLESVNTTSSAAVMPGDVTITPKSMTGITANVTLRVDKGSANDETVTVDSVTPDGKSFTAVFTKTHASGFSIDVTDGSIHTTSKTAVTPGHVTITPASMDKIAKDVDLIVDKGGDNEETVKVEAITPDGKSFTAVFTNTHSTGFTIATKDGSVNTTSNTAVPAGGVTVMPKSMDGIAKGVLLVVGIGTDQEVVTVDDVSDDKKSFTATFVIAHVSGFHIITQVYHETGGFRFEAVVSDSAGNEVAMPFTLAVSDPTDPTGGPLILFANYGTTLPIGTAGDTYSTDQRLASFTALGGTGPYTFALVNGSGAPLANVDSLTLTSPSKGDLTLIGTAASAGAFPFNIRVTDSSSPPVTVTESYTLTVNPGKDSPISISPALLHMAVQGDAYAESVPAPAADPSNPNKGIDEPFLLSAAGGSGGYTFAVSGLPPGMGYTSAGVLEGKPAVARSYSVNVTATDSSGVTSPVQTYTLTVLPAPPNYVTPDMFEQAYGINNITLPGGVQANGSGETIGIVEGHGNDPFFSSSYTIKTTAETAVPAGDVTITPASMTGITQGEQLVAEPGTNNQETVTVDQITDDKKSFTAVFQDTHSNGFAIALNSTSNTAVTPGDVTITPASMVGITTGLLLLVDTGANQEVVVVDQISDDKKSFTAVFQQTHSSGFVITGKGPDGSVNTTSNTAVTPGDVTITPASMAGIVVGEKLVVDTGAMKETVTVKALTPDGTGFTATFTSTHSTGFAITTTDGKVNTTSNTAVPAGGVTITPTSMTGITAGGQLVVDTGANQETVTVDRISDDKKSFTATFTKSHSTGFAIAVVITTSNTAVTPGYVTIMPASMTEITVGGQLLVDTGANQETVTVKALTPDGTGFTAIFQNTHRSGFAITATGVDTKSSTAVPAGGETITPVSMTNITLGEQLVVDTGANEETVTVSSITPDEKSFTATFTQTHSSGFAIAATGGNTTSKTDVKPGVVTIAPASMTGITVGLPLVVGTGANQETVIVKTVSADNTSFTAEFTHSQPAGFQIVFDSYSTSDLAKFDSYFGIQDFGNQPGMPVFLKLDSSSGTDYGTDKADDGEFSQDIEWIHALAPMANIVVFEDGSPNQVVNWMESDLPANLRQALNVNMAPVTVVSESLGEKEPPKPTDGDYIPSAGHPNVTYVASAGDVGQNGESTGVAYPASSPNVLAAGESKLVTDANGTYVGEMGIAGTGAGVSVVEPSPPFQQIIGSPVAQYTTSSRTSPDVDSDGGTGVSIYDSTLSSTKDSTKAISNPNWDAGNGTSLAAPAWAALVALVDQGRSLVSPGSTTSTTAVSAAGKVTITPVSMQGISAGATLQIDLGTNQEYVTVISATGATFTATFTMTHANGFSVVPVTTSATAVSAAGEFAIKPASMQGISAGSTLQVDTGNNREDVTVISVTGTTFTASFALSHASGFFIVPVLSPLASYSAFAGTTSTTEVKAAGEATITPLSMQGIKAGSILVVDTGDNKESVRVTSVTATDFKATFTEKHAAGFSIVPLTSLSANDIHTSLYYLAQASPNDFHYISNMDDGTLNAPGYNLHTGLGSPVANLLVPALVYSNSSPAITSANGATFTASTSGSFAITTSNYPPATSFSETGTLPRGVTLNASTGVLSGQPAAGTGGTYSLKLTATNAAGSSTQSFILTADQAPAITSANAATFTIGTNGSFTVTATGFPAPTLSESGMLPNNVTFNAATGVLRGIPAAGTSGTYALTFTAANGVGADAMQSFTLTVIPAPGSPSITSFTPAAGPVGSQVVVNGTNLSTVTSVTFNGLAAPSFTILSASQLIATVPTGATSGPVTVINPVGQAASTSSFSVNTQTAVPVIAAFAPGSGPVGSQVVLYGANLGATNTISFAGPNSTRIATKNFTVLSPTEVIVTVPSGAVSGMIGLAAAGSVVGSSGSFNVTTQNPVPVISMFSPSSGPVGSQVVLYGVNLGATNTIAFAGPNGSRIATKNFMVLSPTLVIVTVPTGSVSGMIGLAAAGSVVGSNGSFNVTTQTALPVIASFSPGSGPVGSQVVLYGANLAFTSSITFAGTGGSRIATKNFMVVSPAEVIVWVPTGAVSGIITLTANGIVAGSSSSFVVNNTQTAVPVIAAFQPASGAVGSQVLLFGANLGRTNTITFAGPNGSRIAARSFFVLSPTEVYVTVPAGAVSGIISLTANGIVASSSSSFVVTGASTPPASRSFMPVAGLSSATDTQVGNTVAIDGASALARNRSASSAEPAAEQLDAFFAFNAPTK